MSYRIEPGPTFIITFPLVLCTRISDIHGNVVAFEEVLKNLQEQKPDAVVCLGDIVMRGPAPQECVHMLQHLEPLAIIRGNYDHP
jgi:predicted phosphodiesterase